MDTEKAIKLLLEELNYLEKEREIQMKSIQRNMRTAEALMTILSKYTEAMDGWMMT